MNSNQRRSMVGLLGVVLMVLAAGAFAATPVPGGKWSWVWKDAKGNADRPMRVYTYRPRTCDSSCPIVIVLHGASRKASDYRDDWELSADRYKILVIAPEFSEEYWPQSEGYNLGGVGKEQNSEKWVFATIEHLFDEMRVDQASYALYGHGAGAQVAHRMALLRPDNRASAIVAADAGWYTMPEFRKEKATNPFPYSLVNSPSGESALRKALARRMIVMVGEKDDPNAEKLSKDEGAMKEGATRLDRAENFFKAATASAKDLGVKLAWDLVEVPGAPDGRGMGKAGADALFKK
jgi:poly(3-hydroxybutyrate) depolymerase